MRPSPPYAPTSSVVAVITRIRSGYLGPFAPQAYESLGITDNMAHRTLRAIEFLGLIDSVANLTEVGRQLQSASEAEATALLQERLRTAYAPILQKVDPASSSTEAIALAFAGCEPAAQVPKMVSLLRGLCATWGIGGRRGRGAATLRPLQIETPPDARGPKPDLSPIEAVLRQLPPSRRWTKERRDAWVTAMTSLVDLLYEVDEDAEGADVVSDP